MSTLAGSRKIICATEMEREPTRDELARISLIFEDHDGNPRGGDLSAMADRLAELAGSTVEQIKSEGTAWVRFSIGHKDGLTDFHPLYRSLNVWVGHVAGETASYTPPLGSTSEGDTQPARVRSRRHGRG
jgi:hypothetical protein